MARKSVAYLNSLRATSTKKRYVSEKELREYIGVSTGRIAKFIKVGMPRKEVGVFDLKECVRWYTDRLREKYKEYGGKSLTKERAKLVAAQAKSAEVKAQKDSGTVIGIDEVKEEAMLLTQEIKDSLLALPGRISPKLSHKEVGEIKTLLTNSVIGICNKVSDKLAHYKPDVDREKEGEAG